MSDTETKEYYIRLSQHHAGRVIELEARMAALTAALARIREQRCCDHCPAMADAALDAGGGA